MFEWIKNYFIPYDVDGTLWTFNISASLNSIKDEEKFLKGLERYFYVEKNVKMKTMKVDLVNGRVNRKISHEWYSF